MLEHPLYLTCLLPSAISGVGGVPLAFLQEARHVPIRYRDMGNFQLWFSLKTLLFSVFMDSSLS
jgi:hypothetical protein